MRCNAHCNQPANFNNSFGSKRRPNTVAWKCFLVQATIFLCLAKSVLKDHLQSKSILSMLVTIKSYNQVISINFQAAIESSA